MSEYEHIRPVNRASAYILFAAVAGAPLPVGSRDATTIAAWCFVLGLGLLLASPRQMRGAHLALLGGVAFIAACYGFVLHEQLSVHPWIAAPNPIWADTAELLGRPVEPSVSIVRGEPYYAVGKSLAGFLALVLGLVIGADNNRARQVLWVMACSGVGYAAYGLAKMVWGGALTATFINRNTAAAYFGSCAVVWLVLFISKVRSRLPKGPIVWKEAARQFASNSSQEKQLVIRFCLFFICLTAMFLTASRGGSLASLAAMIAVFVLFFRRDIARGPSLILVFVGAGLVAWLLLQIAGGQVEGRIDVAGLSDRGRIETYRSTLKIIADNPWFGTGLGTFAWSFPKYRSGDISVWGVWDLAHSTPLELAVELGIPLTLLFAVGWIVAFAVLLRGTGRSRRETVVPFAALGVCLVAHLHSAVDFSLQVPGYAIVVFALAGVGLAQSFQADRAQQQQEHRHRRERRKKSNGDEAESSDARDGSSASNNAG